MPQADRTLSLSDFEARLINLRENSATAIATSLIVQLDAAKLILALAQTRLMAEEERTKYINSAARIVSAAETRLATSDLETAEISRIFNQIELLWFQIDALT